MSSWLLFVIVYGGVSPSVTTLQFYSEKDCQVAKTKLETQVHSNLFTTCLKQ